MSEKTRLSASEELPEFPKISILIKAIENDLTQRKE